MGTSSASGPGSTADPRRLNVAIARARLALVVVGDLSVVGQVKTKPKNSQIKHAFIGTDGMKITATATLLWNVLYRFYTDGRVMGLGWGCDSGCSGAAGTTADSLCL